MKFSLLIISLSSLIACSSPMAVSANQAILPSHVQSVVNKETWIHGSEDCVSNKDPVFDVYTHDEQSFILRQNKCLTFEAPFIYVLVGESKILLLDTGALADKPEFSLYAELEKLLGKEQLAVKQLLVVHSHSHSDHYTGDAYFEGRENVQVVKTSAAELRSFFNFKDWPQGQAALELGGRIVTLIPTPGHQEEAISLYDQQTKWLMTGDTLYPGYIYVKDWDAYRNSIARLASFVSEHEVTAILGAHIEKKHQAASFFPIGANYHPGEARLELAVNSLSILDAKLKSMSEPDEIIFDDFVIKPMNFFQKTLSNVARWFTQ